MTVNCMEGNLTPSSPIGFEGYEKRLEITFFELPIFLDPDGKGLRALTRSQIDEILEPAKCTIVSELSNKEFDSYVLSESSLFVYPFKIILKTCGTTKLLLSIPPVLKLASALSLTVQAVKYSRGTFIFPTVQPAPHRSFSEEITVLNSFFSKLSPEAFVLGDPAKPNRFWHIYSAVAASQKSQQQEAQPSITLEMCMTGLDSKKASVFFKKSPHSSAKEMTVTAGIPNILPGFEICDFEFDPCGYSMNAIKGSALSTIHVTPEEGFSYGSYEVMGIDPMSVGGLDALVDRVLSCFLPAEFSIAVQYSGNSCEKLVEVDGYRCDQTAVQVLNGGDLLIYQCFSSRPGKAKISSPYSTLYCWEESEEEEEDWKK